jgi:hypothetical protein
MAWSLGSGRRRAAMALVAGIISLAGTGASHASDHLDTPTVIADPRADVSDLYAATLPVVVIYEGRPLAGALVKLTNLEHDATPLELHLTDHAGRATFTMHRSGTWLLNVIWTRPPASSRDSDFETIFSSLSFGFPGAGTQ